MPSERFATFLFRYRFVIFGIWLLHTLLLHYFFLGFVTWDGFGHRGVPVVELFQHGAMGKDKYNEWSLVGYLPFVELVHIPFLYLFKMKGFLLGFPLVVLPLCTAAVYALVHELTTDVRAAAFGAFAYAAIPMVNQQPFSGYIDFAVSGLLAFFLHSLLRLRTSRTARSYVRLGLATAVFTMSRVQGLYVLLVLFPILAYVMFVERDRLRLRIARPRELVLAVAAVAVGSIPAIVVQIWKYEEFGSPSYPVQFEMFGLKIGSGGLALDDYFRLAGLGGHDWRSVWKGAFEGWIWHGGWPIGAFYASTYMAAGLLCSLALILLPFVVRRLTRVEIWLSAGLVIVSLLSRDFAVPRWGYTIVVVLVILLGREMSALSESRPGQPVFWLASVVLFAHLLRPELDYLQFKKAWVSPRMNVTGSSHFVRPAISVEPFPDIAGKFEIIELTANNFVLQIFGRELSNEVVGTIPGASIGANCANLAEVLQREPAVLFIDDHDFTKDCRRTCAITWRNTCRAYKIEPGT